MQPPEDEPKLNLEASVPSPKRRAGPEQLHAQLDAVSRSALVCGLLEAVQGLLAVLNEDRQILVVNHALLSMLGAEDGERLLGLRPGESIGCVHANEEEGGCGNSKFCSSCGAAIAIVTALGKDRPEERECAVTVLKDDTPIDLYFQVRCAPIVFEGQRFLLLFLRDVSIHQQRAALERAFYHDVSNLVDNLSAQSRSLTDPSIEPQTHETAGRLRELIERLAKEIRIQRILVRDPADYPLSVRDAGVERVVANLQRFFLNHAAARGKRLDVAALPAGLTIRTEPYLLERVLLNMLINAFEATGDGGRVTLEVETAEDGVWFTVGNEGRIPEKVALRIFQRNFTTKRGDGRGLGTFAMKLLAETYLGGRVSFTTSPADGTRFRLFLPRTPPHSLQDA